MRQYPLPLALAAFLLIGAGCLSATLQSAPARQPAAPQPAPSAPAPSPTPAPEPHTGGNSGQQVMTNNVQVTFPTLGATVSSPLTITGQARGPWYFEASFPVSLKNASGTVIAQGVAQAQGDWMTVDFVPFTATLTYPAQPAGSTGTLVLIKDDPSGIHPDSVEISVTF